MPARRRGTLQCLLLQTKHIPGGRKVNQAYNGNRVWYVSQVFTSISDSLLSYQVLTLHHFYPSDCLHEQIHDTLVVQLFYLTVLLCTFPTFMWNNSVDVGLKLNYGLTVLIQLYSQHSRSTLENHHLKWISRYFPRIHCIIFILKSCERYSASSPCSTTSPDSHFSSTRHI